MLDWHGKDDLNEVVHDDDDIEDDSDAVELVEHDGIGNYWMIYIKIFVQMYAWVLIHLKAILIMNIISGLR